MCFGAPNITMPPPPKILAPPPAPIESASAAQVGSAETKKSKLGDLLRIPQARNSGTGLNV